MTDEEASFVGTGWNFASHQIVKHTADKYARGDVHTKTIEGFLRYHAFRGYYTGNQTRQDSDANISPHVLRGSGEEMFKRLKFKSYRANGS
jgi:hypothetical protein